MIPRKGPNSPEDCIQATRNSPRGVLPSPNSFSSLTPQRPVEIGLNTARTMSPCNTRSSRLVESTSTRIFAPGAAHVPVAPNRQANKDHRKTRIMIRPTCADCYEQSPTHSTSCSPSSWSFHCTVQTESIEQPRVVTYRRCSRKQSVSTRSDDRKPAASKMAGSRSSSGTGTCSSSIPCSRAHAISRSKSQVISP